ncbi:NADH-quinone oxidoreductase subunit NuoG [Uliginosibacterium sp. 31-16]|uniref:NADH-quinone oxidoreductase subunit NuoG n=1 Tax=Uliginosibacterium sp. 31-16 TaxID=3068315 RepID=UPI00273E6126|nr:NADH-quinone oxidoreductase subunit NuoG [Uliginosibacterium sp. 31-16]MDP5240012.1 NADH-quinone oxidoreductase subunit NuoG [Uliginosibacterium sp. 31-16]
MLEIEIDGQKVEVAAGSTVMEAAHKIGKHIPHFCYHKKLSIAANCRMCLVDVEKMPKAVPACATPVAADMKISTGSEKAVKAQKAVMEFLLINHPLDCPICDQGGECQLQDLAVGYGASGSRYQEEKRVVFNKNLGPLINTDMTRCIHCSRCVRFGQEISGVMELGIANRGEHSEVMAFVDRSVDSELSGNAIDLCPVGALTSKPFRFGARSWEMARRKSVSPHDSLGANLQVQVKHDKVMRVLPLENEDVNECWISDKERFSYEGLQAPDRLTEPQIKHGGVWHKVDWQTALDYVVRTLNDIKSDHGAEQIGALLSPHSTVEEMFLAQKLVRGIGSDNIDSRLRQIDFRLDGKRAGAPWLGMPVAALSTLDAALVVGSFLRKDHPLLAQRLRQAQRRGGKISRVNAVADDWLVPLAAEVIAAPDQMAVSLAAVLAALVEKTGATVIAECAELAGKAVASDAARAVATALLTGEQRAVLLGNFAVQHPNATSLQILAAEIARIAGAGFGFLGESAGSVGTYLSKALPLSGGMNVAQMLASPRKAYILLGVEPELDCADGAAAQAALAQATSVIYMGSFVGKAAEYSDVMLPIAPFSETSGSFVNTEGRAQSFSAVVKPLGETRPAWKVLRVLGNLFGLDDFDQESSETARDEVLAGDIASRLNNAVIGAVVSQDAVAAGLQRIADVPIYFADPLVRRAPSLQKTRDAALPLARLNPATLAQLGIESGQDVKVISSQSRVQLRSRADASVPQGCMRVSAAHASTVALGAMFGELSVELA